MIDDNSGQLTAIVMETGPAPTTSIIWLHGLGASGDDFTGIVAQLGLPQEPGLRFIFPHAPAIPVTINQGMVMPAWYDIIDSGFKRREDAAGIRQSAGLIEQLIQREIDAGIRAENIILAGFSQGGAIALHTGLRYPQRLGGIMALSTYLPLVETLASERHLANQNIPILMMHGVEDTVVVPELAASSRHQLEMLGYPLSWFEYPMAHSLCAAQIREIGQWLRLRLSPLPAAT